MPVTSFLTTLTEMSSKSGMGLVFRRRIVSGLFALLPLFLTVMILKYILNMIGSLAEPVVRTFGEWFWADSRQFWMDYEKFIVLPLSIVIGMGVLLFIGFFAEKGLKSFLDNLFKRIPVVASVYSSIKQVLDVMDSQGSKNSGMFQRACLIKINPNVELLGFVTSVMTDHMSGEKMASVYVPMPPNPTSGLIYVVKLSELRRLDWATDETVRAVVSGGLLAPSELRFKDFDLSDLQKKH